MYYNLKIAGIGGFSDEFYWSSSESEATIIPWIQYFGDGYSDKYYRGFVGYVRAVRAF
jgi:hypothetical protein